MHDLDNAKILSVGDFLSKYPDTKTYRTNRHGMVLTAKTDKEDIEYDYEEGDYVTYERVIPRQPQTYTDVMAASANKAFVSPDDLWGG